MTKRPGGALRALSVVLVCCLVLAGCGRQATGLPQDKDGLTKVSVVLDWYPWANHSGLFLAQSRGYFKEEGLEVNIHPPSNPEDILKVVAAGTDTFGISYQTDVLSARAAGVPVKSIAALVQHPLNSIMVPKGSGITRPKDLEGKKLGSPGIPSNDALLQTMLEADGANSAKVEQVNVGFDLVPALLGKKVDAIIGAYAAHEAIVLEQQGMPVDVLKVQDWGVPDFYELVLVTNDTMVTNNPEIVRKFLRAVARGYQAALADKDAALEALLAVNAETEPDKRAKREIESPSLDQLMPLWTDGVPQFGWQTMERWQRYADWMRERKLLDNDVDVRDCFTTEFLPK